MTRFQVGQLVRVTQIRSLAYGRIAMVMTGKGQEQSLIRFADLPKSVGASRSSTGFVEVFQNADLTPIERVPLGAFYLLVTVVERDDDRRYVHHCLAYGQRGQSQVAVADGVARSWYGSGGMWDEDEQVYRFSLRRFVLVEDWYEISLAEYANLRDVLRDCTVGQNSL